MNLRARKSTLRRDFKERKRRANAYIKIAMALSFMGALSFAVFGSTIHLNGQSQRLSKDIALDESKIYKMEREIQNLKLSIEVRSKRDYIYEQIAQNNLGLRPASPNQIVRLIPSDYNFNNAGSKNKKIAYSSKNSKYNIIVSD